ncbi:hypothetical protein F7725_004844, partial [Dissostichus mawsoni]
SVTDPSPSPSPSPCGSDRPRRVGAATPPPSRGLPLSSGYLLPAMTHWIMVCCDKTSEGQEVKGEEGNSTVSTSSSTRPPPPPLQETLTPSSPAPWARTMDHSGLLCSNTPSASWNGPKGSTFSPGAWNEPYNYTMNKGPAVPPKQHSIIGSSGEGRRTG